jgi:hypothetical protein
MRGETVDGRDVTKTYDQMTELIADVRKNSEPILVDLQTYRLRGHSMSDPGHYRTKEELTAERERDCLAILRGIIVSKKLATEADFEHWDEEAMAAGGALGLAVSTNTINDAVTAKIANLRLADSGTLKLGSLAIEAKDERQLNTQATGDSLTVSHMDFGAMAGAVGVGAASSRNTMEAAITAAVELGSHQVLDVAKDLTVEAQSLAQIETFALAVAISLADGSSASRSGHPPTRTDGCTWRTTARSSGPMSPTSRSTAATPSVPRRSAASCGAMHAVPPA